MLRSRGVPILVFALAVGSVVPVATATAPSPHATLPDAAPAPAASGPQMPVTVAVDRTPSRPGHVRVTYRIEVPANVEEVELRLLERYADERIAVRTDDFTQTRRGDRPRYTAFSAGGTTRSLTVEYALPVDPGRLTDLVPGYDTENWTYLANVRRPLGWVYEGASPRVAYDVTYPGRGFDTGGAAFVGEYDVDVRTFHGQRFHLVVPAGVDTASPRAAVFETFAATSGRLDVGARDEEVYAVALALRRNASEGGVIGRAGDRVLWASANWPATGLNNVWVHEYVHTRQGYAAASDLRWFDEGSARYLESAIPLARGNGSVSVATRRINRRNVSGRLASPASWSADRVPYARGARAVARLNALIIEATDGEASMLTVFRALNVEGTETERPLTGADLRVAIRSETPLEPQSWYRSFVAGTEPIRIDSQWAFVVTPADDPDADGLASSREYDVGTLPFTADTDSDGLDDGAEISNGTDPTARDTDGDGLADPVEIERGLDPTARDTDGDGTPDGAESTATRSPEPSASTPTRTPTEDGGTRTSGDGPGFGVASALLALLVVTGRLRSDD